MRFIADQNVDYQVVALLKRHRHQAWSVHEAGLSNATDDDIAAYAADRKATLLTHDRDFADRLREHTVCRAIWLRVIEMEAPECLERHLDRVIHLLESADEGLVRVSKEGVDYFPARWR